MLVLPLIAAARCAVRLSVAVLAVVAVLAALAAPAVLAGAQPGTPQPGSTQPAAPQPAAPLPATGVPVAAVWREQRLDFYYMGRTSRYSCDGLRDKVRAMLFDLGARRDLKIAAIGCEDGGRARAGPPMPSLHITFSAPALADPSLKPSHEGDLSATDARFEPFTIASDAFRNLGFGDCELVEEFTHQILTKLVTRALRRDITCVPYQASGSRFLVRGEILKSLPVAEQAAGRAVRAP